MEIENQEKQEKKEKRTKGTKQYKTKSENFLRPKTQSQLMNERRIERINRQNQLRRNKMNETFLKRRGIIDSDGNSSINVSKNLSLSLSMLTQQIDMTSYKIPPKICSIIALNEEVNIDNFLNEIELIITNSLIDNEKDNYKYKLNDNIISYIIPGKIYKGKERLTFIKTSRDVYSILDACKVSDIIYFISSYSKTEYDKWQIDPDKYSNCIDEFGYKILSMIRAQGLTDHIGIIQDLSLIPNKRQNEIKKLYQRYLNSEIKPNKIFNFYNNKNKDNPTFELNDENEIKAILRLSCALAPYTTNLDLRKHRSYMLIENIVKDDKNNLNANLYGYIRGNTLIEGKYIHITGFGDYKVLNIEISNDPLPVKSKYEKMNEKTEKKKKNEKNMELDDNKKVKKEINNEIIESHPENTNLNKENIPEIINDELPKDKKENEMKKNEDDDEEIDFNIDIKDDDEDISYHSDTNNEDEEEKKKISNKHKNKTNIKYRSKEEMEFQDEVDTPIDMLAKERFKKYRGLESMKNGNWNPLENLPKEYGSIFSFENIRNTNRLAVKFSIENGEKISGNYIKITIKDFNFDDLKYIKLDIPIVLSTLLDHERKLCVMNYKISPYFEQKDEIIQNLNKKVLECQCGFRRYLIKPIFSIDIYKNSDKIKYEKFLSKDKFYICTTYSQLTYSNSPTLLFTRLNGELSLVGSGISLDSNAKKIILKKIILTGYPVKIKKKKAIIRYMFFNPTDVNYFKPIQLTTKNGLRGNITESVGTHGYMKCIFNDFIKSNDTVCLNLYKRVFPVWFKETWRYKIFNGNRDGYLSYFNINKQDDDVKME